MDGQVLYRVPEGRFFVRHQSAQASWRPGRQAPASLPASIVVGVVAVPMEVDLERVHGVRLNDSLWLDDQRATLFVPPYRETLGEMTADSIVRGLRLAVPVLPDAFEVFMRATMLEHDDADMRWAYIFGVSLGELRSAPRDGLYELAADPAQATCFVEGPERFRGNVIDNVLREPLWGPGGRFGLATSMEPQAYHRWIPGERQRNCTSDPDFASFEMAMQRGGAASESLVYTVEELASRNVLAKAIIRDILARRAMAGADASDEGATAQERVPPASCPRP